MSSSTFSLSSLYGLLHAVFGYHPQLSQQQFSSERGYVERKLQLLCDVLQLCVNKAEELEREKGVVHGSAGKGGVPRVAVMVKEKRRSGGEEREQRKEKQPRQPHAANLQRQAKREERQVEHHEEDDEQDEEDDGDSPQRQREHQHVSFTHDDSSQPLSPSHLSPLSKSMRSPHRLSPSPSHSLSHSHSSQHSSSNSNTASKDPLLALHQQLHRISHRTNQLAAHSNSSQQQQQPAISTHPHEHRDNGTSAIERLMERVQALESSLRDELSGVRVDMQEMRQRLAAVEQREWERTQQQQQCETAKEVRVEEAKESSSCGVAERVTSGGDGGGDSSGGGSDRVLPSDMSEFLTHMNESTQLYGKAVGELTTSTWSTQQ